MSGTGDKRNNRRSHTRFRDPDSTHVRLSVKQMDGQDLEFLALIHDESHRGMACVYIGNPLEVGQEILWLETDRIKTPCEVRRCTELGDDVYRVALQRKGP